MERDRNLRSGPIGRTAIGNIQSDFRDYLDSPTTTWEASPNRPVELVLGVFCPPAPICVVEV